MPCSVPHQDARSPVTYPQYAGKLKDISDPEARERERLRRELPRMKLKDIEDPEAREYERKRRQAKYARKRAKKAPTTSFSVTKPLDMEALKNKAAVERGLRFSISNKSMNGERDRLNFERARKALPEVFRIDENVRSLAIGIHSDIRKILCENHNFTVQEVDRLLIKYTRSNWYLTAIIYGFPRIDILGRDTTSPTPQHVNKAVELLRWKLERRVARRKMFPDLYEKCYGRL